MKAGLNHGDSPARRAEEEVREAENAFAATLAARDLAAFLGFVSLDAVFSGESGPHCGRDAVGEAWAPFFRETEAPFSWMAGEVLAREDGRCALSSGPVFNPRGVRVGTFTSLWRREADGRWRVVHDRGEAWPDDSQ